MFLLFAGWTVLLTLGVLVAGVSLYSLVFLSTSFNNFIDFL